MPQAKRRRVADENGGRQRVSAEEKIARLLGLLLVKDIKRKTDQVPLLRSVGFEVSEIAAILGMTEHHVSVAAHQARKRRGG